MKRGVCNSPVDAYFCLPGLWKKKQKEVTKSTSMFAWEEWDVFFVLSFLSGLCKKCGHPLHLLLCVYLEWVSRQRRTQWGGHSWLKECETAGRVKPHMLFSYFCLFSWQCLIYKILKYGLILVLLTDTVRSIREGRAELIGARIYGDFLFLTHYFFSDLLLPFFLVSLFNHLQRSRFFFFATRVDKKSVWSGIVCWQVHPVLYFTILLYLCHFFFWHHI